MSSWSIGRRVFAGFGFVIVMLTILSVISFFSSQQLSQIFTDYRDTARKTILVNALIEDLFESRMASLKYRLAPSPETAAEVFSNIEEIKAEEEAVFAAFENQPEFLDKKKRLVEQTTVYADAFKNMSELQKQRNEIVAELSALGPKARKQLSSIMESAFQDADARAAYYAGLAQESLMLGRFYTERFLLTNDTEAFDSAGDHFTATEQRLKTLLSELQASSRRENAEATIADLVAYRDASQRVRDVIFQRNDVRANTLDVVGPAIQNELEVVIDQIVEQQNTLGPAGAAQVSETKFAVLAISVIAVGLGGAIAFFIARSITTTIKSTAATMGRLAQDDLDVEISGAEHKHELGEIARALAVFKQNIERVKSFAAEKEQADRAAEEKRAEMMTELSAAFSVAVDAAVSGDFSQRVEANFPDESLNYLAEAINRLLETVGSGVSETGRIMSKIAEGDLGERMQGEFEGAFADLKNNVNDTVSRLDGLVIQITATVRTLRGEVDQITSNAETLAGRAEQQASSLEETAATMEEMSASVKSNADNATRVSTLAADASERANDGGVIVQNAVSAMGQIEEGANKIADIISVIDSIAFQTNLLALNAAVEAARAGDAGKGFAVVASEVRGLAQRSSEASRDIRELITSSTTQVSEGVKLVQETGEALNGIVDSIKDVEASVRNIATASGEQASGVEEISSTVSHMDSITQQNAAVADESASTARRLANGAKDLERLVSFFKTQDRSNESASDEAWHQLEASG